MKLAITRAAAFIDVAHTLLTDTITFAGDAAVKTMVMAETSLVYQHKGFAQSNVVVDLIEDFSQYVPRGHYTLDSKFEHYFRCMMYLGRMNFRDSGKFSRIETMQASVLTRLLAVATSGPSAAKDLWASIYNPTTFFVGRSDDLNFLQYSEVFDRVLGSQWKTAEIGVVYTKLSTLLTELKKLPKPLILSGLDGTPGFHVMGQRFVPDSYAFGQLVYSYVGTGGDPRLFPSGLDMLAVLGSSRAKQLQIEIYHQDKFANYTNQLDSLTKQFAAKPGSQWVDNLYWSWLYTLVPLLQTFDKGYPFFMQSQAWTDKSLTTASGSWAELRHASILYAKQSYTSTTGMPSNCYHFSSYPQGYVEPNPDVFGRLAAMVVFMKNGFDSAGISPVLPISKLTELSGLCVELRDIAIKEFQRDEVTIKEYYDISSCYKTLLAIEDFSNYRIPAISTNSNGSDSTMACLVDVHTDPNSGNVLEVGVGKPMSLFVIAPVEGKLQICRGANFSYYEFLHPLADRMTDAQWQVMLSSLNPSQPTWINSFTSGIDQGSYKNNADDRLAIVSAHDSIPGIFHSGDSVVALLWSDTTPTIELESKITRTVYNGIPLTGTQYYIVFSPEALADTNILTINTLYHFAGSTNPMDPCPSSQVAISHRKVLIRDNNVSNVLIRPPSKADFRHARVQGSRLLLTPGNSWRIVDVCGRQVASLGPKVCQWAAPKSLAHSQLFLVPIGRQSVRPMRFVINN